MNLAQRSQRQRGIQRNPEESTTWLGNSAQFWASRHRSEGPHPHLSLQKNRRCADDCGAFRSGIFMAYSGISGHLRSHETSRHFQTLTDINIMQYHAMTRRSSKIIQDQFKSFPVVSCGFRFGGNMWQLPAYFGYRWFGNLLVQLCTAEDCCCCNKLDIMPCHAMPRKSRLLGSWHGIIPQEMVGGHLSQQNFPAF